MRGQVGAFASLHVEVDALQRLQARAMRVAQNDCTRGKRDIRVLGNALEARPRAETAGRVSVKCAPHSAQHDESMRCYSSDSGPILTLCTVWPRSFPRFRIAW